MYSLHDVEVTGLPLKEVLECEIESRIGEHSTLMLLAYVDEESILYELPDFQKIKVFLSEGKKQNILFSGIVTGMQIQEQGQMKLARIEGRSQSWLMDRTKRSRSFQDTGMTFRELAEEVLESYGNGDLLYAGREQPIGSLLMQYKETDWEFLKRVVSLAGLDLTPDSRQDGLKLYAGVPVLTDTGCPYHVLGMEKDMDSYYQLRANGKEVYTEDFTCYQISSEQILGMFQTVTVQGKCLSVYSCRYCLKGQELQGIYGLQGAKGLKTVATYPMHLIGTALQGKVVNVSGSRIQTLLDIDKGNEGRTDYWFPYSTLSASADGSGWYCMPEIGDTVRIYFPSKQEKEAVALSAVSNYDQPVNGGEDRMADPNSRYLRTKSGQELALAPGYIRLSCGQGAASTTIRKDGTLTVRAQTMVKAEALESLTLRAEETVSIHVSEQFIAQSLNGGQLISEGEEVAFKGTEVQWD